MITRAMVAAVRWILIVLAFACLPLYGSLDIGRGGS
jgi:hypothetical protein